MDNVQHDTRLLENLRYNCNGPILDALQNPDVIELMLNPDGSFWIERYGHDHERIASIPAEKGRLILSLVASALGVTVSQTNPIIEGEFPLDGSRFEGTFPPIVSGPSFSIRKKANRVFTLAEYAAAGSITSDGVDIIHRAVADSSNILVVGGTSSGKTTLVNAIIHAIAELTPEHRLLILEDTAELQSKSENCVFFRTSDVPGGEVSMRKLAKVCMRYAPRRIIVGEVRDAAALDLLKLWNTGHPGGVGTFHADNASEALPRLEELVEEAGVGTKRHLIGRAVDIIIYMHKHNGMRKISEIIKVHFFNAHTKQYETEVLYEDHN